MPAQEQALTKFIDQLHDPASANFHQWLTPNQFGARFGPAASDIQRITGWLQMHGFRVNVTYPSGMAIDFSGDAGQVRAAFPIFPLFGTSSYSTICPSFRPLRLAFSTAEIWTNTSFPPPLCG
jgi:hypothetical protein